MKASGPSTHAFTSFPFLNSGFVGYRSSEWIPSMTLIVPIKKRHGGGFHENLLFRAWY